MSDGLPTGEIRNAHSVNIGPYSCDSSSAITHSAAVNVYFGRRSGLATECAVRRAKPGSESLVKEEGETRARLSKDPFLVKHMPKVFETFVDRGLPVVVVERIKDFVALNQGANRLSRQQRLQLAQELVEYVNRWHRNGLTINDIGNSNPGIPTRPEVAWCKSDRFCFRISPGGQVDWWDLDANITASIEPFFEACYKAEKAVKAEKALQARQKAKDVLRLSELKSHPRITAVVEGINDQLSAFRSAAELSQRATSLLEHKDLGARLQNLLGRQSFADVQAAKYQARAGTARGDESQLKKLINNLDDELLACGIDYADVVSGQLDVYLLADNAADDLFKMCRLIALTKTKDWLPKAAKLGYLSGTSLGELDRDRVGPVADDIRESRRDIYGGMKVDDLSVPVPLLNFGGETILLHGRYQSPEKLVQIIQEELIAVDRFPSQVAAAGSRYTNMVVEEYQALTSIISQLLFGEPNSSSISDIREMIGRIAKKPTPELSNQIAQTLQASLRTKATYIV